jgi:type VI protein secretion system component Hcp
MEICEGEKVDSKTLMIKRIEKRNDMRKYFSYKIKSFQI